MSLISSLYDGFLSWLNEWSYDRCKERRIIIPVDELIGVVNDLVVESTKQIQLRYARATLADWDFREDELGDRDWRDDLTDDEVIDWVERDYPGGWNQFLIDGDL